MSEENDNEIVNPAAAPESEAKKWIKEFRALDTEIKEAGKLLGLMRKRRKALDQAVLAWMQAQGFVRVKLNETHFLERNIKSSQKAVNADRIVDVLSQEFENNNEKVASLVSSIYNDRPVEDVEILKVVKAGAKKRVRPVDGEDADADA